VLRWLTLTFALLATPAAAAEWVLSMAEPRVKAGARFELELRAPAGEALPDTIGLRIRGDRAGRVIAAQASAPADGARRAYAGVVPQTASGTLVLELIDRESSAVVLLVEPAPGTLRELVTRESAQTLEPPLSENDPIYFIVGTRGGTTARLQLSFKYRLFDRELGWGREQPWLAELYFGYTQTSIWNLSDKSAPFRDTSYRPSLFWLWQRADDKTWIDALRAGYEHESNGKDGASSRTIDTLFLRPEWVWTLADGNRIEFTPKVYGYLDKEDNADIQRYRGYVDWRLRYGDRERIWSAMARLGTAGKGSLTLDYSQRTRVLGIGPLSGYFHAQLFAGYGETILDYNRRRKTQLRVGFAIIP
jgi:outer membrane phospholipase A